MAGLLMKKPITKQPVWLRVAITSYFAVVVAIGIGAIGANALNDSLTGLTFGDYFCNTIAPMGGAIIIALTVLMLLSAGITYMVSMGQSGGDTGIGTAKAMITAAITGFLLYMMSTFLLGQCGFTPTGWIFQLFGGTRVETGSPDQPA